MVFTLGMSTAFAMTQYFSDENNFPSWAKDSIYSMKNLGIINGYSDGSFKPDNNVTRAELAKILSNYESYKETEIDGALLRYASLNKYDLDEETKMVLALASSKRLALEGKPTSLNDYDCKSVSPSKMPNFWTVYKCDQLGTFYYANFVYNGAVPESGSSQPISLNQWYGPFNYSVGDIKSFF